TVRVRPRKPTDLRPMATAKADADGFARFADIKPDLDTIAVEAFAERFRVGPNFGGRAEDFENGVMEVKLEPGIPFDGRIVDDATGGPFGGGSVGVRDWSEDFEFGPPASNGRFHVPAVMNDHPASVFARARGHCSAVLSVAIDSGKPTPSEPV